MDPITDLTHRYADAVCRFDRETWAALWVDDGQWDMGGGVITGADIAATWTSIMSTMGAVIHLIHNGTAALDEDAGTGEGRWYVTEHLRMGDGSTMTMHAWYDDTYRRVDGEWRFASRTLHPLYQGPADHSGRFLHED